MAKENCAGLCPAYFDELVGPTRARYKEKIALCDGVDPYRLPVGAQAAVNASLLPPVTHVDIINYLVLSTKYIINYLVLCFIRSDEGLQVARLAQLLYERMGPEPHCQEVAV